jgi:hypothetical protein
MADATQAAENAEAGSTEPSLQAAPWRFFAVREVGTESGSR